MKKSDGFADCFGHTVSIVIPGGEAMSFDPGQDSTLRERPKGLCALGCGAWGADLFLSSLVFRKSRNYTSEKNPYNIL